MHIESMPGSACCTGSRPLLRPSHSPPPTPSTTPPGPAGGASSVLPGRTAGGEAEAAKRQLAPRLQADIRAALVEYQPEAVADYLQVWLWLR